MTNFDILQATGLTLDEYLVRQGAMNPTSIVDEYSGEDMLIDSTWDEYQAEQAMFAEEFSDEDEDDYWDYYDEGAASNMPCDNYGLCAGPDCPQFFRCQGRVK